MQDTVDAGSRNPAPDSSIDGSVLKGVIESYLRLFADFAPDADAKDVKEFTNLLVEVRAQLSTSGHDQEVRRLASTALKSCEQFLKRSRQYYATREAELTDMIGILRETAQNLAGDSTEFHEQMQATTKRFRGMVELEDIRELKRDLAGEANVLLRTIEEKQKRDEKTLNALSQKVEMLQAHLVHADEQASIDPLTRIANRGSFDRSLVHMVQTARTMNGPLSLALLDIDHFKSINDTHGHPIGDRVLLCAAQWLAGATRRTDMVARYGGEEFAIILPDADLAVAEARFGPVLTQIASRRFDYDSETGPRSVQFTMSCGITQLADSDTPQDLILRADRALYDAKRAGRNRVAVRKRSKLGVLFG